MRRILPVTLTLLVLAAPARTGMAMDGGMLYLRLCSSCHGSDGEGAKAPALKKEGLLQTTGIEYLEKSIRYGRTTPGCPSNEGKLQDEEIKSIASFIKGWQKNPALAAPAYDVEPMYSRRGEEIFSLCGGCHGPDGEGAFGPALLDKGLLKSISDTELRTTIRYGRPGTPMRGFQKGSGVIANLTDEEIDQVISYIRYLEKDIRQGRP